MNKKTLILILVFSFFLFFLFPFSILFSIEVGGHITEDTTWSPDNNPYIVTQNLYIDEDVTLTILPGTIIKLIAAEFTQINDYDFYFNNGDTVAKMFWVDGRIIAEGAEEDSIIFTRVQDSLYYHWGTIYISPQAELCIFNHCHFEYSALIVVNIGLQPKGAIALYNGQAMIKNCHFIDNYMGISLKGQSQNILIKNNLFNFQQGLYPSSINSSKSHLYFDNNLGNSEQILISGNRFTGANTLSSSGNSIQFVNNTVSNCVTAIHCHNFDSPSYFYKNEFINNSSHSINSIGPSTDTLYIKKNRFIIEGENSDGVDLDDVYTVISDNVFDGCRLICPTGNSKVINNIVKNSLGTAFSGNISKITNNIIYNCDIGFSGRGSNQFSNNIIINNNSAFSFLTDNHIIENEIIIGNNELIDWPPHIYGNPIFRNCILDFELPEECIDGGDNIWVDSLSVDSLFVDWQNGDFHLLPGSPAIDAGYDTTDYCPFDMDYNIRVWDGDNNGNTIIDIGPYEFGAPQLGGICGTVYQTENGEPLDYVLLKINNEPGEFEFSDSSGFFEFRMQAGVYDIYAERVFYDDVVIEDIEVIDGEFTEVEIPMTTTLVGIDEQPFQPSEISDLNIYNYPNPVHNSTTISFTIPRDITEAELKIYNIKGQLVKQFLPEINNKTRVIDFVWDTKDESGKPVANGIYFYKLSTDKKSIIKKVILLR